MPKTGNVFFTPLSNVWGNYKRFAKTATSGDTPNELKLINYWREKLFTAFSIYFIPVSFIAIIPGVWMSIKEGLYFIAWFDVLAAAALGIIIFNKKLRLNFRKAFAVGILYLLAVFLTAALGLFGPGALYLITLTVFITLVFPVKWAYWTVALHCITYTCFTLIIAFRLFHSPLLNEYTPGSWIAFSSNLIFLSLVSVVLISKVINGLENTIINENQLQKRLLREAAAKSRLNVRLIESEGHYKSLFFLNPSPMWVFDAETLQFLQVNDAAIKIYGYTEEEFLSMTIKDIRFANDTENLVTMLANAIKNNEAIQVITKHWGKDRQPFPVDVRYNAIPFKGKKAALGIVRDISQQVKHTTAIEYQNGKLMEIAFIQSHVVRAPLSRIMGLVSLLMVEENEHLKLDMLTYLNVSANEFDEIIKSIIARTEQFSDLDHLPETADDVRYN